MAKQFAKQQPKHGDPVATCGHLDAQTSHFFQVQGEPLKFIRPDGSFGEAAWFVLCDSCFMDSVVKKKEIDQYIRHDAIWQGDRPIIEEDKSN